MSGLSWCAERKGGAPAGWPGGIVLVPRDVEYRSGAALGMAVKSVSKWRRMKQHDHELPGLQFGLQFTAVRPSSLGYARWV
jgi:hypothetical protein